MSKRSTILLVGAAMFLGTPAVAQTTDPAVTTDVPAIPADDDDDGDEGKLGLLGLLGLAGLLGLKRRDHDHVHHHDTVNRTTTTR